MTSFERIISKSGRRATGRCLAALVVGLMIVPFAALAETSEQGTPRSDAGQAVSSEQVSEQQTVAEPATSSQLPAASEQQPEGSPQPPASSDQQTNEQQPVNSEQQTPPPAETPPTETPAPPSDTSASETDATATPPEIPVATTTPSATQDSSNPQTTIDGGLLVSTVDPADATSTGGAELGVDEGQGVSGMGQGTGDAPAAEGSGITNQESGDNETPSRETDEGQKPNDEGNIQEAEGTPTPAASKVEPPSPPPAESQKPNDEKADVIATMPIQALKPKKEFVFRVNGSVIAAKARPSWQSRTSGEDGKTGSSQDVADAPAFAEEADTGALVVSGSCALEYFVVILYRHPEDYDRDPASYVINKAFPCENGRYSYAISDLPPTLGNGTYYLLIAEQGSGPWKPITAVQAVAIMRNE